MRLHRDRPPEDEIGLERLIFFSDAVFAIAITLLVLELRLPEIPREGISVNSPEMDMAVLRGLWDIASKYLGYFLSFAVIGLVWMGHHRTYRYIGRYDSVLLLLNLLLLMVVAFIPFPTGLIGDYYGNRVALVFYAGILTLTGLASTVLWWYVTRDGSLLKEGVDLEKARERRWDFLVLPALFVLAAIVALWSSDLAWIIMWGVLLYSILDQVLATIRTPARRFPTMKEAGDKHIEPTKTTDN